MHHYNLDDKNSMNRLNRPPIAGSSVSRYWGRVGQCWYLPGMCSGRSNSPDKWTLWWYRILNVEYDFELEKNTFYFGAPIPLLFIWYVWKYIKKQYYLPLSYIWNNIILSFIIVSVSIVDSVIQGSTSWATDWHTGKYGNRIWFSLFPSSLQHSIPFLFQSEPDQNINEWAPVPQVSPNLPRIKKEHLGCFLTVDGKPYSLFQHRIHPLNTLHSTTFMPKSSPFPHPSNICTKPQPQNTNTIYNSIQGSYHWNVIHIKLFDTLFTRSPPLLQKTLPIYEDRHKIQWCVTLYPRGPPHGSAPLNLSHASPGKVHLAKWLYTGCIYHELEASPEHIGAWRLVATSLWDAYQKGAGSNLMFYKKVAAPIAQLRLLYQPASYIHAAQRPASFSHAQSWAQARADVRG